VLAFLDIAVAPGWSLDEPSLLRVGAGGVDHRDRARNRAQVPLDVLDLVYHEAMGTALLDVLPACSPGVLRRVRAGLQAVAGSFDRITPAGARLAGELAQVVASRDWGEADAAFLAIVSGPEDHEVRARLAMTATRGSTTTSTPVPGWPACSRRPAPLMATAGSMPSSRRCCPLPSRSDCRATSTSPTARSSRRCWPSTAFRPTTLTVSRTTRHGASSGNRATVAHASAGARVIPADTIWPTAHGRGTPQSIRACDWDQITVWGSSC
jgi:hypothetical protein